MRIKGRNLLDGIKKGEFLGQVACNDHVFEQPKARKRQWCHATDEMRQRNKSARFDEVLMPYQKFDVEAAKLADARERGGLSLTHEYSVWMDVFIRCYQPGSASYPRYGAVGIRVCQKWFDFEAFLEDIGRIPPGWELDRINSKGDYSPENCRLVDRRTQARNRRSNHLIEWTNPMTGEMEIRCMVDWAEIFGVNYRRFAERIYRAGYDWAFAYAQRKFDERRRQLLADTHNPYAFCDLLEA